MTLNPTESVIREKLIDSLVNLPDGKAAVFFREMFIQNFARRADLVVANGKLAAFEIKSGRDSLGRLEGQLDAYAEHFEQVTIVVATKHLASVMLSTSRSVGIWEVADHGEIVVHRKAPDRHVTKSKLLTFLPVDELRVCLKEHGRPSFGDRAVLLKFADALKHGEIRTFVLSYMHRRHQRIESIKQRRDNERMSQQDAIAQRLETQRRLELYLNTVAGSNAVSATPRRAAYSESSSSYRSPLSAI